MPHVRSLLLGCFLLQVAEQPHSFRTGEHTAQAGAASEAVNLVDHSAWARGPSLLEQLHKVSQLCTASHY